MNYILRFQYNLWLFCFSNGMDWEQKVDSPVRISEEIEKEDSLSMRHTGTLRNQFPLRYFQMTKSGKIRL